MSLATVTFPKLNLKQDGTLCGVETSKCKDLRLKLLSDRVRLCSWPPGGNNFPSMSKLVSNQFISPSHLAVGQKEPSADWDTYRHVDLFLFPSVCGHSARRRKKKKLLVTLGCARAQKKTLPVTFTYPHLRKKIYLLFDISVDRSQNMKSTVCSLSWVCLHTI